MHTTMLDTAAMFAVAVALIHSILGERRLIGPILDEVPPGPKILKAPLARKILRFAWHITSLSWIAQAAIFVIVATMPPGAQSRPIVAVIGVDKGLDHGLKARLDELMREYRWGDDIR